MTGDLFKTKIWGLLEPYIKGLEASGATTLVIPPQAEARLPALLKKLDGLLLPGGMDIDPAHFGEEPVPELGDISNERDGLELYLARYAAEHGLPVLGICRGHQVMNVALGGSLYQDLPAAGYRKIQHSQKAEPGALAHTVEQTSTSPLRKIFDTRFRVNSYHHQAIKELAPGMKPVAVAPDGVVEAAQLDGHPFFFSVQWHPELLPAQWGIFQALAEATQVASR